MQEATTIATVNYQDFISGDPERKSDFVQKIGTAFSDIGFAIVSNHPVTEEQRKNLFEASEKFFLLTDKIKQKYEIDDLAGQRGYIGKQKETAKGRFIPDLKEFYHVGQELDVELLKSLNYPQNIWVNEVPELREYSLEVFRSFENTGCDLLRAIALFLELNEDYFDKKIEHGNSILRLLHYYPVEDIYSIPEGAERAGAHEDINLITLLMGASAEGLQAKTASGKWLDVNPQPNQIVVNMGDMMQRLTNGKLRSTTHRVINKDIELMKSSRYSSPFFLHPISNMDLTSLPSTVNHEHPKQFPDLTAGEYLNERLIELGLKK